MVFRQQSVVAARSMISRSQVLITKITRATPAFQQGVSRPPELQRRFESMVTTLSS